MHRVLLRLHLIAALAAGAFLAVFGITGSIMAFEPELDHLLHRRESYVTPQGTPKSLAALATAASTALPAAKATGYLLSASPDLSYQVLFGSRRVFVDQYTGAVLGVRDAGPDFLARVHQLHLRLLIQNRADTGKTIMTWAGAALLVLLFSGLYLWWPLKRYTIAGRRARRLWFDIHNTVGIFTFVFLLALGVTGVVIGFDDDFVPLIYKTTRSAPLVMYARLPPMKATPSGPSIGPDRAVAIATAALPGATPVSVNVPPPTGVYTIAARYPEDSTPGGRSRVLVDQYSGAVLMAEGSRTAPAGSRLITLNRAIHTGDVFGIPSKAVMSMASLAVVVQLASGLLLWWRKRSRGREAR